MPVRYNFNAWEGWVCNAISLKPCANVIICQTTLKTLILINPTHKEKREIVTARNIDLYLQYQKCETCRNCDIRFTELRQIDPNCDRMTSDSQNSG